MLTVAKGSYDFVHCTETTFRNALRANSYELKDRDAVMPCHMRRMSISRKANVRIISSFNLDKDVVVSSFMQKQNLTIDQVDRLGSDYKKHKEGFRINWALDYMGYSSHFDKAFAVERTCPISDSMNQVVEIAVEDTYLPISHDLPCMSKKLLRDMVGLEILEELKLNVRNGREKVEWEMDVSCVDFALAKAMATKLVKLFDGTDLTSVENWQEGARLVEERCTKREDQAVDLQWEEMKRWDNLDRRVRFPNKGERLKIYMGHWFEQCGPKIRFQEVNATHIVVEDPSGRLLELSNYPVTDDTFWVEPSEMDVCAHSTWRLHRYCKDAVNLTKAEKPLLLQFGDSKHSRRFG